MLVFTPRIRNSLRLRLSLAAVACKVSGLVTITDHLFTFRQSMTPHCKSFCYLQLIFKCTCSDSIFTASSGRGFLRGTYSQVLNVTTMRRKPHTSLYNHYIGGWNKNKCAEQSNHVLQSTPKSCKRLPHRPGIPRRETISKWRVSSIYQVQPKTPSVPMENSGIKLWWWPYLEGVSLWDDLDKEWVVVRGDDGTGKGRGGVEPNSHAFAYNRSSLENLQFNSSPTTVGLEAKMNET